MIQVYRYKAHDVWHCAAPTEAVVAVFGDLNKFETYFGCGTTYGRPSEPDYVGVWGNRNASPLRRLLREALGAIEILGSEPPVRLTTYSRTGHRLNRAEREMMLDRPNP